MDNSLWQCVLQCDPFATKDDIVEIREVGDNDILITFKEGRKILYDRFTGYHKNVNYDDVKEITDEQEKKEFAYKLRSIMNHKGVTQEQLASKVGTSQVMISRYVTGEAMPNALTLRKIAISLNCSMDDFFCAKI